MFNAQCTTKPTKYLNMANTDEKWNACSKILTSYSKATEYNTEKLQKESREGILASVSWMLMKIFFEGNSFDATETNAFILWVSERLRLNYTYYKSVLKTKTPRGHSKHRKDDHSLVEMKHIWGFCCCEEKWRKSSRVAKVLHEE